MTYAQDKCQKKLGAAPRKHKLDIRRTVASSHAMRLRKEVHPGNNRERARTQLRRAARPKALGGCLIRRYKARLAPEQSGAPFFRCLLGAARRRKLKKLQTPITSLKPVAGLAWIAAACRSLQAHAVRGVFPIAHRIASMRIHWARPLPRTVRLRLLTHIAPRIIRLLRGYLVQCGFVRLVVGLGGRVLFRWCGLIRLRETLPGRLPGNH